MPLGKLAFLAAWHQASVHHAKMAEQLHGSKPCKGHAKLVLWQFSYDPCPLCWFVQVHVAEDFNGKKLAVKVQHEGLREGYRADLATIQTLVNFTKWVFPEFDYQVN